MAVGTPTDVVGHGLINDDIDFVLSHGLFTTDASGPVGPVDIGAKWIAEPGGRKWVAGGKNMGAMVRNTIKEASPGSGNFRAAMDFGDMKELHADGVSIDSCAVTISPSGPTVTSPATLETDYSVSTVISGTATSGLTYSVSFTATLSTGQVLPPRIGDWLVA